MIVGEEICEVRVRSFFMDKSLVCSILVLFLRFSKTGWVSIDIGDGLLRISQTENIPDLLALSEIYDDFAYPVQNSHELDNYFGKKIKAVYEYKITDVEDGCVGVYIDFGSEGVSILEMDDNLSIADGLVVLSENISLSKIDI